MSEAKKKANRKYNEKAYDQLKIVVKKGERDIIKAYAESIGKSLNGYIKELIISDMESKGIKLRANAADAEPTDK